MLKSKMIKHLQALPGDPDILLWHSLVGDWTHIQSLETRTLCRRTLAAYVEMSRLRECNQRWDWDFQFTAEELLDLAVAHKREPWGFGEFVSSEDLAKDYETKEVVLLTPKRRFLSTPDRLGNIDY